MSGAEVVWTAGQQAPRCWTEPVRFLVWSYYAWIKKIITGKRLKG